VLRLLELLETSGSRTLRELSDDLDIDPRTVRRYVEQLRDMEIPVESLRGRYGGYRLAAGFRMPPILLSSDEALAVVLGLLHAQAIPTIPPAALHTAMSKVRRALPADSSHKLDVLLQTAAIDAAGVDTAVPDPDILLTVADAVARRYPLAIRYGARPVADRSLEPEDLIFHARRWYLVAHDVEASARRTFRVDRIRAARRRPGALTPIEKTDTTHAVSDLVEGFARSPRRWRVELLVHTDETTIRARFPASVAVILPAPRRLGPEWRRVEIQAQRLDWLPPAIAALDCPVRVDAPEELRSLLAETAARLAAAASPRSWDDGESPER